MNQLWSIPMLLCGGLFAGGVLSIAWERLPAWRSADIGTFRATFADTLQRVDRFQPTLLVVCLVSTIGVVITANSAARVLAACAGAIELGVLAGSGAVLVPIQKRLVASGGEDQLTVTEADRLRAQWCRGHIVRTALALTFLILAIVAAAV